jgi:outer membrane protein OmpA-like peptidoglycan-associated protein
VRIERFAAELKANPAVDATVQVCASGSDAANVQLASRRASSLKAALVAHRVDADRISTKVCRAEESGSVSGTASDQDGQIIAIVLDRQS